MTRFGQALFLVLPAWQRLRDLSLPFWGFVRRRSRLQRLEALRAERRKEARGDRFEVSASDPLNLAGIVTPGARVPAQSAQPLVLRDGVPVDASAGIPSRCQPAIPDRRVLPSRPES